MFSNCKLSLLRKLHGAPSRAEMLLSLAALALALVAVDAFLPRVAARSLEPAVATRAIAVPVPVPAPGARAPMAMPAEATMHSEVDFGAVEHEPDPSPRAIGAYER